MNFLFLQLGKVILCIVEADVYRSNNKKIPSSRLHKYVLIHVLL